MPKLVFFLFLAVTVAGSAWSQEETPVAEADETAAEAVSVEPEEEAEEIDETGLDEQIYEEDEDDFVPTEEIPTDEPIPFPSNI